MDKQLIEQVLNEYGFQPEQFDYRPFGTGHINSTWLISIKNRSEQYILQSINRNVFKEPERIAGNVRLLSDYLKQHNPNYLFVGAIPTRFGKEMAFIGDIYWRLTEFIKNSVSFDTLSDPDQAYEAAVQFGRLNRLLADFDASQLQETIPGFHDLGLRYQQFTDALEQSSQNFKLKADSEIQKAKKYSFILEYFNSIKNSRDFPNRAMHHDTKISNMLFDRDTMKGICVIDLDTMMSGKYISDLGDMMRTYLCAFSENEPDIDKIFIRIDYFEAIIKGYLYEMGSILTKVEKDLILFSGKYLIYMQAIRFLSDYLNGSIYYPISYPEQNLDRAKNQFKLLTEFFEKEKKLNEIVNKCLNNNSFNF
ncbi:MAG: aminoglycoside phosphotransferase family protein [Bacteroidetes bacterium]|nr:aminoglycoside phosphotransferase family protein [Bacteroidota bacterium]